MATYDISPTLIQCFGVILLGYLSGKLKLITSIQGKGLTTFIGTFSLPALIFKAMVEVDFAKLNWSFWLSLLLAKAIVFVIVMVVTLLLMKGKRFAAAGLYSIFVSQSNDIAFGLPLLQAVFQDPSTRFLVDYVFLTAPISLAILNPIGFAFMEYQKAIDLQANEDKKVSYSKIVKTTVKGVITNPLVFMIVFGIAFNFVFKQHLPPILEGLFVSLGSAFGATALFFLGWKLGCQQNRLSGFGYTLPIVLVFLKSVFLPIIMILVVSSLTNGSVKGDTVSQFQANSTDTAMEYKNNTAYQTFAFLYGAIPTAPTVLVYATKYNFAEEMIGNGLIIGTFLSAPIIFVSIRMLQVKNMVHVELFDVLIGRVSKDVSICSVLCCVFVQLVMILLKGYKKTPHAETMILILFQFLLALTGSIYGEYADATGSTSRALAFFVLYALFSCPIWSSMIGFRLTMIARNQTISQRVDNLIKGAAVCIPFLMALIIAVTSSSAEISDGSSYFFMFNCFKDHYAIATMYTIINLFTMIVFVITFTSLRKMNLLENERRVKPLLQEILEKENNSPTESSYADTEEKMCRSSSSSSSFANTIETLENLQMNQKFSQRRHITHHVVLLLIMFFIILLNCALTLWSNIDNDNSSVQGFYLELRMITVVLTYGQGFFTFAIFGFVREFFMLPCFDSLYRLYLRLRGRRKIILKEESDLTYQTTTDCNKFIRHHLIQCSKDIVTNLRFRLKTFEGVYTGCSFVDWLIEERLANDRAEAVEYGNILMQGRVIEHCVQEHFFYDLPYFYQFTRSSLEKCADQMSEST